MTSHCLPFERALGSREDMVLAEVGGGHRGREHSAQDSPGGGKLHPTSLSLRSPATRPHPRAITEYPPGA